MANLKDKLIEHLFGEIINRRVKLATAALEDLRDLQYTNRYPQDRYDYDREEVLRDALEAWRVNPIARRIVALTTQYVVGRGIGVESDHEPTNEYLQEFWDHRLNRMKTRCNELCDEITRAGDLFIGISTDTAGMSYVRAIPASLIQEIETAANDLEQEAVIWEKPNLQEGTPSTDGLSRGLRWEVYSDQDDLPSDEGGFKPVMLHYAINRPVGALWGESDLAPLLRWLSRYANWLEDRVRLNRYRNTFLFWVKAKFGSDAERLQRQAELNANPPTPGSILVTDDTETWDVLASKLDSFEAGEDGLTIKKILAAGSGTPLHFLAEPESATRTTAEAAGGPTFRHYEQRQEYFLWMLEDILRVVVKRRAAVDRRIKADAKIKITGADISQRDNAALATATTTAVAAFSTLRDRGLIDDSELLRIAYRFAGEVTDIEEMLKRGAAAPPPKNLNPDASRPGWGASAPSNGKPKVPGVKVKPVEVNPVSGEPTGQQ
jgi:hypothetical protein